MYACLHVPPSAGGASRSAELLYLAMQFSPAAEQTAPDTVVFSAAPLQALFGTPQNLASEISRYEYDLKLNANLAFAANIDTAVLLARNRSGVTFAPPGREAEMLSSFPLAVLFVHEPSFDPVVLDLLERWGLKTCEDLTALPEKGIAERLGAPGVQLRNLALGRIQRPLRITARETKYESEMKLDDPVDTLEPLLFLFGRALHDLYEKLRSQSQAARVLHVILALADVVPDTEARLPDVPGKFVCQLEFPVPLDDSRAILKLLQLHLERHSPNAPVSGFSLRIESADPKRLQGGLFLPPTPVPDKLQITMARIAGLVGEHNVGAPDLLNTHRPDAFRLTPLTVRETPAASAAPVPTSLHLALRIFRPVLYARVRVVGFQPKEVIASSVQGKVIEAAGPWRTTGDWWTRTPWARDEWDVELSDGALYRIYCESQTKEWFVQAVYD